MSKHWVSIGTMVEGCPLLMYCVFWATASDWKIVCSKSCEAKGGNDKSPCGLKLCDKGSAGRSDHLVARMSIFLFLLSQLEDARQWWTGPTWLEGVAFEDSLKSTSVCLFVGMTVRTSRASIHVAGSPSCGAKRTCVPSFKLLGPFAQQLIS
jgi:hypothetical protein